LVLLSRPLETAGTLSFAFRPSPPVCAHPAINNATAQTNIIRISDILLTTTCSAQSKIVNLQSSIVNDPSSTIHIPSGGGVFNRPRSKQSQCTHASNPIADQFTASLPPGQFPHRNQTIPRLKSIMLRILVIIFAVIVLFVLLRGLFSGGDSK
jgi:hypothetical protein